MFVMLVRENIRKTGSDYILRCFCHRRRIANLTLESRDGLSLNVKKLSRFAINFTFPLLFLR